MFEKKYNTQTIQLNKKLVFITYTYTTVYNTKLVF